MRLTIQAARSFVVLAALLAAPSLAAQGDVGVRATSSNSVTFNRGTPREGNKGVPMDPSRVNRGTPIQGNKGHAIAPSSANEGTVVVGSKGHALEGNRGDVAMEPSRYVSVEPDAEHDSGCCYGYGAHRAPASAATATAPVGSVVRSVPSSCIAVFVGGKTYQQCGGTWYEPSFTGTSTTYTVTTPRI